jgi:UDP-glucose 4-epimerase
VSALAGRDVLVTGGAGFVGSRLVARLAAEGARVTVLDRPGAPAPPADRAEFVGADLADAAALAGALGARRPGVVFHLAAWTGGRGRADDPEAWRLSRRVNLDGTMNLLLALLARGGPLPRVVRTGTMEEYGDGPVPFREDQRERAVSPYSASVVAATQAAHALAEHHGLPLVTVRPSVIYGPGQDESFFLPSLVRACVEGREFAMTAGTQTTDYVHVDDVAGALCAAAIAGGATGEIVNAGSGREVAIREVAERVAAMAGGTANIRFGAMPGRAGEAPRRFLDVAKAERLLGWRARTALDDGLRGLVAAARAAS